MHAEHLADFEERHHLPHAPGHERRTQVVVALTAVTMVAEIAVGLWSGSLALFADGVHMATHVGALGLTALAYWFARTRARDAAFTFGTGKVYALSGYTSALLLAGAAAWMIVESVLRLLHPEAVRFGEALPVAVLGLLVNLVSAKLLEHDHDHGHAHHDHAGHDHAHHDHAHHDHAHHDHDHHDHDHAGHGHDHAPARPVEDHNLRAAYLHVLADALTSLFAIVALLAGRYLGLGFLDAVMGIVGALVILKWSAGLVRSASRQLLDMSPSVDEAHGLRTHLEGIDDVSVSDLHLWEIGPGQRGCIVALVTSTPRETSFYREAIRARLDVSHLTVEVRRCEHGH